MERQPPDMEGSKHSRKAGNGCSSTLGFGCGVTNPRRRKLTRYRLTIQNLGFGGPCEHGTEPSGSTKDDDFLG
jgi:hypothetical protein